MNGLAKLANESPLTFKEQYRENLRRILAKQHNIDPALMTDEKMEEIQANERKKGLERTVGLYGLAGGGLLGHKAYREGLLTGRRTFYHNTDKGNVEKIKQNGLKATYATDPDNLTQSALRSAVTMGSIDPKSLENKVYLGNSPVPAFEAGIQSQTGGRAQTLFEQLDSVPDALRNRKTMKIEMPLDDVENLQKVDNPELRGAKNAREFHDKMNEFKDKIEQNNLYGPDIPRSRLKDWAVFQGLGKGTTVVEGDIPSQFIKGGEGFKPLSGKDVWTHIKNRPGHFAKGLGVAGAGLALTGGGAHLMREGSRKTDYNESV